MSKVFHFYGGVHPSEGKLSSKEAIVSAPLLAQYTIPVSMHIGAPAKPLVQAGDKVLRGQMLAEGSAFVSAAIHSPTSGTIKSLGFCLGPMGTQISCFTLEADGEDRAVDPLPAITDWQNADPAILKKRIADAGIVGMGGAAFPTPVKLSPPPGKEVDTLVINGVECEPCLTADHRLMLESPLRILEGAAIVAYVLGVTNVIIGIENNKPDAIETLTKLAAEHFPMIRVQSLQVRYPQGAEKQLIYSVTKRKVPTGGLPADVRCVVQNIGTIFAIAEAVLEGKPLYERVTTVTGSPIAHPGNWRFRIGTPYAEAIKLAGGTTGPVAKLISGGPMMGMAVYSQEIPIMKNTSGILLMAPSEVSQFTSNACIRCGRCNDACPMQLMPGILSNQIENENFDDAGNWHVMDCIECGCCAYTCPGCVPLVLAFRAAKHRIKEAQTAPAAKK
jgi:electron transport complex protein RnfC